MDCSADMTIVARKITSIQLLGWNIYLSMGTFFCGLRIELNITINMSCAYVYECTVHPAYFKVFDTEHDDAPVDNRLPHFQISP